MKYFLLCTFLFFGISRSFSQDAIHVNAVLKEEAHGFIIKQEINFENSSQDTLTEIYLNDWANAFVDKTTPLAKRFAEEYARRFHFADKEERGHTQIYSLTSLTQDSLNWERPLGHQDLIKISLKKGLLPGHNIKFNLHYFVKLPSDKFTRYGVDESGNYKLKYWYITPAVYKNGWQLYSDRDLANLYTPPLKNTISVEIPSYYRAFTALNKKDSTSNGEITHIKFEGNQRVDPKFYLTRNFQPENIPIQSHQIITDIEDDGLGLDSKKIILNRILNFLQDRLGDYPHQKMMVMREDYLRSPVYGLNQLPSFIRPFPDGFQYDIKQLKTISRYFLQNTILINPRNEEWVNDGIMVSLMIDYVNKYYPKMKLLGNLSNIIGLRWFHAADLEFNDQYQFLYMNMARLNLDQPLTTAQDSLVKFNKNIANAYKAGVGLKYVNAYTGDHSVDKTISEFYSENKLKLTSAQEFERMLKKNSSKDLSWFFKDYVGTNKKIDFRIKNVKKDGDSLKVTIKNKGENGMPISLFGINDGQTIYKTWVDSVHNLKTVSIPRKGIKRVGVNYDGVIPEYNQRDNYKAVTTFFNKPIQFRLLQDIEDPRYNQIFLIPEFDYNLYDGFSVGPKIYNKTFLSKNLYFQVAPKYGFTSKTLVGSASISYTQSLENQSLYAIRYGISGTRFSYAENLFYKKYSPFIYFAFRNNYLRDNEKQSLILRNINVERDFNENDLADEPNYNVFNLNYRYSNPNLINYFTGSFDYQIAKKFSKVSLSLEYRKLFRNNRQLNLRFFAGTFLYNDNVDSDYFSFALDRPTDYLFDYNYYGRSEGGGLFSQQLIIAEGGFKSQLQPAYANQWITTLNASTNIWNWIYAYGDIGALKNRYNTPEFVYDSGVRVSLVADYFELFFPVYSNLGWEISQPNYDQKIRFIVSLDINTLVRLFTRRWY